MILCLRLASFEVGIGDTGDLTEPKWREVAILYDLGPNKGANLKQPTAFIIDFSRVIHRESQRDYHPSNLQTAPCQWLAERNLLSGKFDRGCHPKAQG